MQHVSQSQFCSNSFTSLPTADQACSFTQSLCSLEEEGEEKKDRTRHRFLILGLMYKITGDLIPAILPPQNYLTPVSASRRRIRPTKYEDFEVTNIIDRHEVGNTRGFQLPAYNTKQYQNSFFVRTVEDWNHLEENIVKAGFASAFTSALSRSTPPAS